SEQAAGCHLEATRRSLHQPAGKQIVLEQETDTFLLTSTDEDSKHSEGEANSDQFLSYNLPANESPHQEGSKYVDSELSRNAVVKPKKSHNREISHSNNVDKSSLSESHNDTDTGRKSVKFDVCENTFKNRYQVKKHHKIHKGVKQHACNVCRKSFSLRSELKVHMRTHTGEKRYSCETCGKRFSHPSDLTAHMRMHTCEKPFSCERCGKSFSCSGNLTVHMRTHTDIDLLLCMKCALQIKTLCRVLLFLLCFLCD
uniref:C2H2-type domain-containing protein n=1 Tax=Acanthochromis polyacanthus TaxID=80966 RepID=A0A3Q1G9J1_9TELE